jgi:hypothetical protein
MKQVDILDEIYKLFIQNEIIHANCAGRIKYYSIPETLDTKKPYILITPLEPPREVFFSSNVPSVQSVAVQVDVLGSNRKLIKQIQTQVKECLQEINLKQETGGLDTFLEESRRFVDARRYSGLPFLLF